MVTGGSRLRLLQCGASTIVMGMLAVAAPAMAQTTQENTGAASVEEVVVTGQRAAIRSAQAIKQNSEEVVDSIVADDIGKLPDRSVTEALQRVTGVTIDHFMARNDPDHFSVEGSGIAVRGLTFVRSELNGRDSFSATNGRGLSFEDVPPELMAGVDVYKNPSAEQIEGGIGGLVNLRTRLPFDSPKRIIGVSASVTRGDLRKEDKPSGSVLFSDRWQTPFGEFGALVDFAYSENATRTDGIQVEPFYPRTDLVAGQTVWVPKGANWRTLLFTRKRTGAYGALQWRPTDTVEMSLTYFRSQYQMHWDENAIFSQTGGYATQPAPGTSFTFDNRGVFQRGTMWDPSNGGMPMNSDVRSADRDSLTEDWSFNARFTPNEKWAFKMDAQYIRAKTNGFDSTVATGTVLPTETIDLTGGVPNISVAAGEPFLTNPNNYYWAFTMDHVDENHGKQWTWRTDGEYSFDSDVLKTLRFGVRFTGRDLDNKNSPYNWQAVTQTWMLGWYIPRLASLQEFPIESQVYGFPDFYRGDANLPGSVVFPSVGQAVGFPGTYQVLHALRQQLCRQMDPNCVWQWAPAPYGPDNLNVQHEITSAAYAQLRFGFDDLAWPISGNVGVRVVKTDNEARGNIVYPTVNIPTGGATPFPGCRIAGQPAPCPQVTPGAQAITAAHDYTNVLPSLNLTMKIRPNLQARFAAAQAVTRPSFDQIQAYTPLSINIDSATGQVTFTGTGNNPYLEPIKSDNLDATLEWYFAPTGSVTAAVFYKKLHDIIRPQTFSQQIGAYTYNITGPANVGEGTIKGFELAWNQFFDFLPGAFSGFGAAANFTYVDSKSDSEAVGRDINGAPIGDLPLEGLSKYSYNLIGMYEKGPISARLAYNWRSEYLLTVDSNGTNGNDAPGPGGSAHWNLPTYNDDYGQLDGSFFYKFMGGKLEVGIEAQNLTNAENRVLMRQTVPGVQGRAWFISDRRYTLQLRALF